MSIMSINMSIMTCAIAYLDNWRDLGGTSEFNIM